MSEPRKRKSGADRKAEIVETAIRLSAKIGPDRVTTQHLADAVGVTQPAIFRHFSTKSDIWLAVGDHIVGEMAAMSGHTADLASADPHDQLHQIVGHHFVHVANNPAVPAILFSQELQTENESLRVKFSGLLTLRREQIAALVRHAQAQGLHRAELAAEDAAQLVIAAMQGLSMRWLLENQVFDIAEEGARVLGGLLDSFRT